MEPTKRKPRIVTAIVQDLNPVLEDYFNKLLRFIPMFVRQVHESSGHGPLVVKTNAYSFMGMFYNLLIRKEMYNLMGQKAVDQKAFVTLKEIVDYYSPSSDTKSKPENGKEECSADAEELPRPDPSDTDVDDEKKVCPVDTEKNLTSVPCDTDDASEDDDKGKECPVDTEENRVSVPSEGDDESEDDDEWEDCPIDRKQVPKFVVSFKKFRDPKNATIDIIEDVFNITALNRAFYRHPILPFDPEFLNMDNIKNVVKHTATFDRTHILLNPIVGCEYFFADANFILDDVFLQINTSVRHFEVKQVKCKRHMYQLLLYALGVFVRESKEIRKFKVYNPLLGYEYFYEIPHLDFNEFLKLVQEIEPL